MKKYYLIPLLLLFSIILFGCETDGSNDSPVITGNDAVSYVVNSLEPDWTTLVSVEDAEDGAIDIDLSMIDLTNVNMNSTGYFTVVYSVNDSDGNISHFMITVEITSGNVQNDQPIIYGPAQLEFFLNSAEPDWASFLTASDNEDGNIQITSSMIDASAVKYDQLSYSEVLEKDLKVMDAAAIALSRENNLPLYVLNIADQRSLIEFIKGKNTCPFH